MDWLGYYAARGLTDLVKDELRSPERGESYLLPDERARQSAWARLAADADIEASRIEVRVLSGELTLLGTVPTESMKARAAELCSGLAAVTRVVNELHVG